MPVTLLRAIHCSAVLVAALICGCSSRGTGDLPTNSDTSVLHNGHWINYLARGDRVWFVAIVTADIARDAKGYKFGTPTMEDYHNGVATVWDYLDGQGKGLVRFRVLVGENGELPSCEANGRTFSLGDGIVLVASRTDGKVVINQIDVREFRVPNIDLNDFDASTDATVKALSDTPELRDILAAHGDP